MKSWQRSSCSVGTQIGPRKVERLDSTRVGIGMSNLRIGDRNARSHAPSAGAAQPAHSPWLTAFLASSPPPCASPLPQPNHLGLSRLLSTSPTRPLVHSSTASPRLASLAIRLDCIRPLPLLHYGEIPAQQRLHSNATTLTSDFPSTCHSSPNLLPLSCVSLHHRPLNNPRAFRPSSRPRRRPPRSSRRPALVSSHLALVEFPWSRPDSSVPFAFLQTALRSSRTHATRPPKRSSSSRRTRRRSLLTSKAGELCLPSPTSAIPIDLSCLAFCV